MVLLTLCDLRRPSLYAKGEQVRRGRKEGREEKTEEVKREEQWGERKGRIEI